MPHVGWIVEDRDGNQTRYTFDEALALCKQQGHFDNWPAAALQRMKRTRQDGLWLSPSGPENCIRRRMLEAEVPYYLNPNGEWAAGIGTAIHNWFEDDDNPNHELKLSMTLEVPYQNEDGSIEMVDVVCKGTTDVAEDGLITDFKTISDVMKWDPETKSRKKRRFPEPNHVAQVNIYRMLCEFNDIPVDRAQIVYLQVKNKGFRQAVDVPLWDLEETYLYAVEMAVPIAAVIKTGQMPAAYQEDHPQYWKCRWCPVAAECRRLEAEGK